MKTDFVENMKYVLPPKYIKNGVKYNTSLCPFAILVRAIDVPRRKLNRAMISNIGSNIGQQEWSSDLLSTRNYRYPWWHNHELEEHSLRTASSIVPWFQLLRITLLPCHFVTLLTCSALLPAFTLFPCHLVTGFYPISLSPSSFDTCLLCFLVSTSLPCSFDTF